MVAMGLGCWEADHPDRDRRTAHGRRKRSAWARRRNGTDITGEEAQVWDLRHLRWLPGRLAHTPPPRGRSGVLQSTRQITRFWHFLRMPRAAGATTLQNSVF